MFERFTERARQVVVLAQEEARKEKADRIDTGAILLGLIREEEGLAAQVLESYEVVEDGAREIWRNIAAASPEGLPINVEPSTGTGQVPLTSYAKKSLELSLREALSLGHNYIGTEHILLGMVRLVECVGAHVLQEAYDLDGETIRNEVIRRLSGPSGSSAKKKKPAEPTPDEYIAAQMEKLADHALSVAHMLRHRPAKAHDFPLVLGNSGVAQITRERIRQVEEEGYTEGHDDGHTNEQLVRAAVVYAMPGPLGDSGMWPWAAEDFRLGPNRITELVKAGALIAAEIDRLQRKEAKQS